MEENLKDQPVVDTMDGTQSGKASKAKKSLISKTLAVLVIGIVYTVGLIYLGYSLSQKQFSAKPARENTRQQELDKISNVKVGQYEVVSKTKYNQSWEEVEYQDVKIAVNKDQVYSVFSQLYPKYTDNKQEFYVKDIKVTGEIAEVYFGGDEEYYTNRMGTTGPYHYAGLLTFALTEDSRVKKVHLNIQQGGTHAGPTPPQSREDFIYLWSDPMLRDAANNGNNQAKEILDFRLTESTTTNGTQPQKITVKLYYHDLKLDPNTYFCEANNYIEKEIPKTNSSIKDSINTLIRSDIFEKDDRFILKSINLKQDGTLILEFPWIGGFTTGGSCRIGILTSQIVKTALQFPEVKKVVFNPEVFQP